jgi:hypothetical protein
MKRDLELVRRILLDIEDNRETSGGHSSWSSLVDEGYTPQAIQYHVQLLHDAGLIHADELVPGQWWPERITWAGHEFLDSARNDKLWNEAKRRVERELGSASFQVVHELLIRMANESLERAPQKRIRHK